LSQFYQRYNYARPHSGIKNLPPAKYWALYDMVLAHVTYNDKKKAKTTIAVPYHDILLIPVIRKYDLRVMRAGGTLALF